MKKATLLSLSILLLSISCSTNKDSTTLKFSNKEKAIALLKSIETQSQEPISYINSNNYKQHNLDIKDGLAGFGEALSLLPEGSARVNTVRAFEDGHYVFTHTDYNFFGEKVGFDIFKFEGGLIIEHWDNLAAKTLVNPSGHTQLDGQTTITDLSKTEENKSSVKRFVNDILVNGKMELLSSFFNEDNYIQHNSQIADQLSGLGKALAAWAEQGIYMKYDTIHMVLGEGNFVLTVSEGTLAGEDKAFYDLFRVEKGRIAEHWDIIETIPTKDKWKNRNGKF